MEKTYTGKINNKGNQKVEALVKTGTSKKGKMITRRYDECPKCHFCQYNNRNNNQEKK